MTSHSERLVQPREALPPGPPGLPWFGSIFRMFRDPLKWALDMGHNYGPVSYARIGPLVVYMLNEPSLIEAALMGKHRECIKDRWVRELKSLVGEGLLTSEGEHWRYHRKLAAPPLQPKRIASYASTMVECTEGMFDGYAADSVRDVSNDMSWIALQIASRTLLGFDATSDVADLSDVFYASLDYFDAQYYSPEGLLPAWVSTPRRRRYRAALERFDRMLYGVIERCRKQDDSADHLLARLLHARGENGEALGDVEVRDETATMLLAGYETSSLTLSYACYLLANHPEHTKRVRAEVDGVLGDRAVSADDLQRLPLLDAVVRESLRLYPPAYMIGREAIERFELGGYVIPRGAQIAICPYTMHRDPRFYPEPNRFAPERWLSPQARQLPRFAYLPFGGGPRICIGNHFAMLEAAIVLATMLQRFELEPVAGFELKLHPAVTLRPVGSMPIRFVRRRPHSTSAVNGTRVQLAQH